MAMKVTFSTEAREKLAKGVNIIAPAVVATLGPRGQNVAIERPGGAIPAVLHDGVSVAKEIELEDPIENMGASLAKVASKQTNALAGDGTTTSMLFVQSIVNMGLQAIKKGANSQMLKLGIEEAVKTLSDRVKKIAVPVKDKDIIKVATLAAQNPEIGKLIDTAIKKVGKDGLITTQESQGLGLSIEYKEGMEIENGYLSAYFSTDVDKLVTEIDDPYILLTDKRLFAINDLMPFFEQIIKANRKVIIIAGDVTGEILAFLITNRLRNTLIPLALRAPSNGDRMLDVLEDIAAVTGGTVITEESGRKLQSVKLEDCGRAERVYADENVTRIIGGKGKQEKIDARIAYIKEQLNQPDIDEFNKKRLTARLNKFANGAAVIMVGATTEAEQRDKKERIIDAISATKSAIEEGIVPGAGTTFLRIRKSLNYREDNLLDRLMVLSGYLPPISEKDLGIKIIYKALEEPVRVLAKNSGMDSDRVLKTVEMLQNKEPFHHYGLNCITRVIEPLLDSGIIDSAKVVRLSIENAASVAAMILTTDVVVNHIPEQK